MPHLTLHAPDITCDHCILTIHRTTDTVAGARFVSGDPDARSFVVDLASGGVLETLAGALAAEGYPLAEQAAGAGTPAPAEIDGEEAHAGDVDPRSIGWAPSYRVTRTAAGADVNYDCYCGCDAGFALDRSQPDPAAESCCCGNHMLIGRDAGTRLGARLDAPGAYRIEATPLTMPWGQPLEVALAIPTAEGGDTSHG